MTVSHMPPPHSSMVHAFVRFVKCVVYNVAVALWHALVSVVDQVTDHAILRDSRAWRIVPTRSAAIHYHQSDLPSTRTPVVLIYYLEGCRECKSQRIHHEKQPYFDSGEVRFVLCNDTNEMRAHGIKRVPRSFLLSDTHDRPIDLGCSISEVKKALTRYIRPALSTVVDVPPPPADLGVVD